MKKLLSLLLIICLIPIAGCTQQKTENSEKIQVVATLFPQYDFARQIGGNKVDVTLLLPAGSESHNFDPTPSDMVRISKSDLFIYTGDNMEPWASSIAASVGSSVTVLDASSNAVFEEGDSHSHDESHNHSLDPHIWLDFDNAKIMAENIANALIELSPENEDYFSENLLLFNKSVDELDGEYARLFAENPNNTIVFGGKFALGYLVRHYNINYKSAYDSCSANAEPSIADISSLSSFVAENNIKAVYCEEYTDPKVAKTIASANNALVLPIHSCHNISKEDRENNVTFLSLMTQNLENLRKGME